MASRAPWEGPCPSLTGTRVLGHFVLPAARISKPAKVLLRALEVRVLNINGRQVLHLLLRYLEPDAVLDPGTACSMGMANSRWPLEVTLLQEHVGDLACLRVDDELDAVRCRHRLRARALLVARPPRRRAQSRR